MNRIVKETTNTGRSYAPGLGLKIEDLAYHSGFPEKMPVKKRRLLNGGTEFRNHSQRKSALPGNGLPAAHGGRFLRILAFGQQIERETNFPARSRELDVPVFAGGKSFSMGAHKNWERHASRKALRSSSFRTNI